MPDVACLDGNEAVARVAHALSEVIAIYPITPASPMGELADAWSAAGRTNRWGAVPEVVQLQSEAGAAGTLHGATQKGVLATTFTASQGLLLMLPDMFKIAGELSPAVIHVAARAVATHALSIFGDHSDVMAARTTGFALLSSSSVQEAHDLALVAHAATLRSRVPFLHFMDGFRTSHQVDRIDLLGDDDLDALVRTDDLLAHRARGLDPNRPVLRGTAQDPDVFFQSREAANPYYDAVPGIVAGLLDELARRTGRRYGLVDYHGAPDAERVLVLMGSAAGAARETVDELVRRGERVGMLTVRLYRPFPTEALLAALPATVRSIAVMDRTKEPGAVGEPLYTDVVAALAEGIAAGTATLTGLPRIVGARYGLASKELTPALLKGLLDELDAPAPRRHVTVGIVDDVTHLSVAPDPSFRVPRARLQAVLYGLGSDGTVGAARSSVRIAAERTGGWAQGYFVYDSKKSGSVTASHLRVDDEPILSTYLVDEADVIACHQLTLLDRIDVLGRAAPGATVLLASPHPAGELWERLPDHVQARLVELDANLWCVDAHAIARDVGIPGRINTVMQPCFLVLAGLLDPAEAVAAVRESIEQEYGKRGRTIVERNVAAAERALAALARVEPGPARPAPRPVRIPEDAPDFVRRVTARVMAGEGDLLPVSAFPVDGTFPTGTARWEKRAIAAELPVWDPELCIDCGKCAIVCPHAAIRMKVYEPAALDGAPEGFQSKPFRSRDVEGHLLTIQVAPDDCTGCGVCVDVCPARSKEAVRHKALDMAPAGEHRDVQRAGFDFFLGIPEIDRTLLARDTVKGSQVLEPLFEFSGACAGCGETPYLKLLTQLFGDRIVVANATGCSSIYGGNLPTTPWSANAEGRGPAWSNSLFEDNAEFGLGLRLGLEARREEAVRRLQALAGRAGADRVAAILAAVDDDGEAAIAAQRERVAELKAWLATQGDDGARLLAAVADDLVRSSIWIVGGDGWAYDIGFGGLDHVLGSGRDVNVLVLDTEVYSNTGGQASKATPRGAVAKFAASGKAATKKDLGAIARAYGNVYVAQVALGASDIQTVKALLEADAWPGPSLVIAYSTCIAHGIDMATSMSHQKDAVRCGYWPLYRFRPSDDPDAQPFQLDSRPPSMPVADFALQEGRFSMLARSDPERARHLLELAQADIDERWRYYEQEAGLVRQAPAAVPVEIEQR